MTVLGDLVGCPCEPAVGVAVERLRIERGEGAGDPKDRLRQECLEGDGPGGGGQFVARPADPGVPGAPAEVARRRPSRIDAGQQRPGQGDDEPRRAEAALHRRRPRPARDGPGLSSSPARPSAVITWQPATIATVVRQLLCSS